MAEQKMRFTDNELATIKAVFADRDELLKLLRKIFQFAELTEEEQKIVKQAFTPEAIKVISKSFLPQVDLEAPINQVIDLWMTVEVKDKDLETLLINLRSREALIDLLEKGIKRLSKPEGVFKSAVGFKLSKTNDKVMDDVIALMARNTLITHIEAQLNQLKVLAGQKEETVEETKERLFKNSSK